MEKILNFETIDYIDFSSSIEKIKEKLKEENIAYIKGLPTESGLFLSLLEEIGVPIHNYSSKSLLNDNSPNAYINKVKMKTPKQGEAKSVHYISEALLPHSARSWRNPRPKYFSMLMVEPGLRGYEFGNNGESHLLHWESFFSTLSAEDGRKYQENLSLIKEIEVNFKANNVVEETAKLPIIYELSNPQSEYDYGVRLKQDILDKFETFSDQIPSEIKERYKQALEYFVNKANQDKYQTSYVMEVGDVIIMDNDRFAHGRYSIVRGEELNCESLSNPRELWSATVDMHNMSYSEESNMKYTKNEEETSKKPSGDNADLSAMQSELDELLSNDELDILNSFDSAISKVQSVEESNVTDVQLVALSEG